MTESIKEAQDFKEANTAIRAFYNKNSEQITTSASGGWGPFSASVGYGKTTEQMKQDFFKDDKEFWEFRSKHIAGSGKEARVVPMGLKLIKRGTFKANVGNAASSLLVQPIARAAKFTVPTQANLGSADRIKVLESSVFEAIGRIETALTTRLSQLETQVTKRGGELEDFRTAQNATVPPQLTVVTLPRPSPVETRAWVDVPDAWEPPRL